MTAVIDTPGMGRSLADATPQVVRVLEVDPDLGSGLDPVQRAFATNASVAACFSFGRGPWEFRPAPDRGGLGALILAGLILVRIEVADRCHAELLGEGDVISPWVTSGPDLTVPSSLSAQIVAPVEIALLDRAYALRTARWPELQSALVHRLILRSRRLSLQSAINAIPRIQQRLELTLWHLASSFGRVTRDGVRLRLPLSHAQLAEILATQRPSVTIALARMQASGRLIRAGSHDWLLVGPSPAELVPLAQQCGLEA